MAGRYRPGFGSPGHPRLGRSLVDPVTGDLHDFEAFPGDLPPDDPRVASAAERWGRRQLFHAQAGNSFSDTQTLIQTQDLGLTHPIYVQIRFALADVNQNAVLPYSPAFPPSVPGLNVTVNVRRGTDQYSPVTTDSFTFTQDTSGVGQVLPFDITYGRVLGVDVTLNSPGLIDQLLWIEAMAVPVIDIGQQDRIIGWKVANHTTVGANAASVLLLPAFHADRAQFIITNTSTDGDLYVAFGPVASVVTAALVLPHGTFARYESPVGGYNGVVSGIWVGGVPGGTALVTEGTYH